MSCFNNSTSYAIYMTNDYMKELKINDKYGHHLFVIARTKEKVEAEVVAAAAALNTSLATTVHDSFVASQEASWFAATMNTLHISSVLLNPVLMGAPADVVL